MYTFYKKKGEKFDAKKFEAQYPFVAKECDLTVVDHLGYFDRHETKNKYTSQVDFVAEIMHILMDSVFTEKKPVVLVSHLRKESPGAEKRIIPSMEDLHGSSDIYKVATKVIMMAKAERKEDADPRFQPTYIRAVKDRYGDNVAHYCACVDFDIQRGEFKEEYILGSTNYQNTKFTEVAKQYEPYWFRRSQETKVVDNKVYEISPQEDLGF